MSGSSSPGPSGGACGCLLLHGFSGSPREMVPLADVLRQERWTVSLATLAGHGTSPQDLARTRWQDWVASAQQAYAELRRRCDRVGIVGLSMGGALALYLAATADPAAVVAISTPIRLRPFLAGAARLASRVLPLAPVLLRLSPRDPAVRAYRSPYTRIPLGATADLAALLAAMREALPRLRAPVLLVQGRRDWVVPAESAPAIASRLGVPARVLWLPRSGHVATLDVDRELLFSEVRQFLRLHLKGETGGGAADRAQ